MQGRLPVPVGGSHESTRCSALREKLGHDGLLAPDHGGHEGVPAITVAVVFPPANPGRRAVRHDGPHNGQMTT